MPNLFFVETPKVVACARIETKREGEVPAFEQLGRILEKQGIHTDNINYYDNSKEDEDESVMAVFPCPADDSERVLNALTDFGIGSAFGTVSLVPLQLYKSHNKLKSKAAEEMDTAGVRSRMIVEQVVEQTRAGAALTFDYIMLVIVASLLAGFGLALSSSVTIVASMLVSPLMGPILAVTFGTMIKDHELAMIGLRSELIGLAISVAVGFMMAFVMGPFSSVNYPPGFPWPNIQQTSRGQWQGLIGGLAIALPSGLGVALSVLGNNTSSLVGVAISASLLPPAVNAGMLWCFGLFGHWLDAGNPIGHGTFMGYGAYSLLLTLLNIAAIYAAATAMFKLKAVAPIPGKPAFWKKHVARTLKQKKEDITPLDADAEEGGTKAKGWGKVKSKVGRRGSWKLDDAMMFGQHDADDTSSRSLSVGGDPSQEADEDTPLVQPGYGAVEV